jgi:topoisomerase-4 subunit A
MAMAEDDDSILLHDSAARDYLEYAIAVVKGRALPDVKDGLKPVQRRVLFAMRELGLSATAKPVKSARVVGDVIGKYHPHGDTSAYDAMVRVAQPFMLRYPLVDGQGNFGSRDGDNAAAMRYTEARLTPIAELLLGELGEGTVDFQPNYDGSFEEPAFLPARLPFLLLNGASGIAVGMATEMPAHNLREVAAAAIHKIEHPAAGVDELMALVPDPIIRAAARSFLARRHRRRLSQWPRQPARAGALRDRGDGARRLATGVHRVAAGRFIGQGALRNRRPAQPAAAAGQEGDRAVGGAAEDADGLAARPRARRVGQGRRRAAGLRTEQFAHRPPRVRGLLLAHTSLETSAPINLVAVGIDGRPCQKSLADLIGEWCTFRMRTVHRRTEFRLQKADDRIHILEGRHIVFLNIDEVIRIIRESDDPKAALIARFILSDRQAEDILEIRLRQLARLEGIRIEQELAKLRGEREGLLKLLGSDTLLRRQVIREIKADAEKHGDARRTIIETAATASRCGSGGRRRRAGDRDHFRERLGTGRQGHGLDLSGVVFKDGDRAGSAQECRSVDSLVILSTEGRAFTVAVASLPDGRGMGAPLSSFVELGSGRIAHVITGRPDDELLIAKTSGYGFICKYGDLLSRQKAGKAFLAVEDGATILPLLRIRPARIIWRHFPKTAAC